MQSIKIKPHLYLLIQLTRMCPILSKLENQCFIARTIENKTIYSHYNIALIEQRLDLTVEL